MKDLLKRLIVDWLRRLIGLPRWSYELKGMEVDGPGLRAMAQVFNDLADRCDKGELVYMTGGFILKPSVGMVNDKWSASINLDCDLKFKAPGGV